MRKIWYCLERVSFMVFRPSYNRLIRSPKIRRSSTDYGRWGIGIMMYQLATLRGLPDLTSPIPPPFFLHGQPAIGSVYGRELGNLNYTQNLKDCIHECLYEVPGNRPSLVVLKTRIRTLLNELMAVRPCPILEPYSDFEIPGPDTP